jgi:hypothetical protein
MQSLQAEAPFDSEYVPAVQFMHAKAAVVLDTDPAGQGKQSASDERVVPTAPYDPGVQGDPLHAE